MNVLYRRHQTYTTRHGTANAWQNVPKSISWEPCLSTLRWDVYIFYELSDDDPAEQLSTTLQECSHPRPSLATTLGIPPVSDRRGNYGCFADLCSPIPKILRSSPPPLDGRPPQSCAVLSGEEYSTSTRAGPFTRTPIPVPPLLRPTILSLVRKPLRAPQLSRGD